MLELLVRKATPFWTFDEYFSLLLPSNVSTERQLCVLVTRKPASSLVTFFFKSGLQLLRVYCFFSFFYLHEVILKSNIFARETMMQNTPWKLNLLKWLENLFLLTLNNAWKKLIFRISILYCIFALGSRNNETQDFAEKNSCIILELYSKFFDFTEMWCII